MLPCDAAVDGGALAEGINGLLGRRRGRVGQRRGRRVGMVQYMLLLGRVPAEETGGDGFEVRIARLGKGGGGGEVKGRRGAEEVLELGGGGEDFEVSGMVVEEREITVVRERGEGKPILRTRVVVVGAVVVHVLCFV